MCAIFFYDVVIARSMVGGPTKLLKSTAALFRAKMNITADTRPVHVEIVSELRRKYAVCFGRCYLANPPLNLVRFVRNIVYHIRIKNAFPRISHGTAGGLIG